MMKLRINPIVAEDLKNIKEYIAEDNEEMAVKTIQEIYARIENIQQLPYMGADLTKRVSFRTDYKYVICGNYVVLYKIGKEYVEIYRVVNGRVVTVSFIGMKLKFHLRETFVPSA